MTGYYEIAPARTVGPSFQLARFTVVLLLVAGLAHRYALLGAADLLRVIGVAFGLLLLSALLWVHAFLQVWRKGRPGGRRLAAAAVFLVLASLPFAFAGYGMLRYPALNDISTDREDPPRFFAIQQVPRTPDANRPGDVSPDPARQDAAYPQITGRRYTTSPDIVFAEIDRMIADDGWSSVHRAGTLQEDEEVSVEGIVRSPILRFPADVVIRLTDEGDSTYVDMRSASHYGRHDLGGNARFIGGFLTDLDAAMLARAGG